MKLFKIIASQGGRVLFDDRLEAPTPREARNQMRALLGLRSLTGVVYSITELPVELIGEIAETKLGEALRRFEDGATPPSLSEAIRVAAAEEVRRQLAELRAESLATAAAVPESNGSNGSNGHASRFDPFSDGAESTLDPGNSSACAVTPSPASSQSVAGSKERRRHQSRGRPAVTTDGRTIDWKAVKKLYRRNRSLKQTAAAFDLSVNTVKARARKEGWAQ
jgi:hypothetical protein